MVTKAIGGRVSDPLFHQVPVSGQVCNGVWGENKQMSPQAGEIAVSDSSLLRLGVSCATKADERQSKMKCILPDVNMANCESPGQTVIKEKREREKGKENAFISGNIKAGAENWENWMEVWSTATLLRGDYWCQKLEKTGLKTQEK